jgi:hypothetical protein
MTQRSLCAHRGARSCVEAGEMAGVGYHEPVEELSDATRDMHRAPVSLMEDYLFTDKPIAHG